MEDSVLKESEESTGRSPEELPELLKDHGMWVYTTPDQPGFLATLKSRSVSRGNSSNMKSRVFDLDQKILW